MSSVRKQVDAWDAVVLPGHPLRGTLVSTLFEGASVHEFFIASHRERSMDCKYNSGKFQAAVFASRVVPAYAGVVDAALQPLIARGCVAKWKDFQDLARPEWSGRG